MNTKKLLAAVTGVTMLAGMLTVCGSSSDSSTASSSDPNTLTIWAWDDNFNVKAANIAKEYYQKEHPDVTVNVVSMAQDDIVQTLNTAFSSGTYKGLPNIVLIEDYRIQNYLNAYPGELRDLSNTVNPDDFMDYKLGVMTQDNKVYGVPFDSGVAALFYRTDYIEEAGYTTDDMQDLTWSEFIQIGKDVKEKTGKYMLTLDPSDLGQIRMMMQSAGAWYVKEDGKTVDIADNEVLKESVKTYQQIIDAGIAEQISGWDPFVGAFQKGDVASVPTGCWIAPTIAAAEDQSGKWAVAPLPRLDNVDSSLNPSNIGGGSWYVLDKVGNGELAENFLAETFASNVDLMNDLVSEINLVSTLKASADAEKSSETEGAEVNADESSGADMSATEAAEETSEAAETTAAEPFEATTVTVFAAKSLNTVMEELIAEYNKTQPNVSIVGSYDSSGTLMTQIEEGAACDVFFSAAQKQMDQLQDEDGLAVDGTRHNVVNNQVCVVTWKGSGTEVTGLSDIGKAKSIALADGSVPVGKYTRQAMVNAGMLDKVDDVSQITTSEIQEALGGVEINECANVGAVTAAVAEGSNEVGTVYYSDTYGFEDRLQILEVVPYELTGNVIYPVAQIINKEADELEQSAAEDFINFLTSDDAKTIFQKYYFDTDVE